jgi:uncharacterized membrane protein
MQSDWFQYNKAKVIQALRYHFISRKEIKVMMILVNVFAVLSAILFYSKKISPLAFLVSSFLWFVLMITFWHLLPRSIYKRSATFQDRLQVAAEESGLTIENERGRQSWRWTDFSSWMETPYFFHLYFNSRSFFIVPKEAFPGDRESEFRMWLKKQIRS